MAANAIWHGRVDEGMELERRFAAAREASGRIWDPPLVWEGPGNATPGWGRWYMSTPASWFVLQALLGVTYDALTGVLTVRPARWSDLGGTLRAAPVFHPLFWASIDSDAAGWTLTIDRLRGAGTRLVVRTLVVAADLADALATYDGRPLPIAKRSNDARTCRLAVDLTIAAPAVLHLGKSA